MSTKAITLDADKLTAAGFTVIDGEGGALIATADMKHPQFVPMIGDQLMLLPERSALHRSIMAALGATPPATPGSSGAGYAPRAYGS